MKYVAIILLLLPLTCLACGEPSATPAHAHSVSSNCVGLLRQIDEIVPKADWKSCVLQANHVTAALPASGLDENGKPRPPPPPPPAGNALGPVDPSYCKLIDPNAHVDACLADAMTETAMRNEPFCPSMQGMIADGDLAFLVLSDRHPGLWEAVLGQGVKYREYFRIVNTPRKRQHLQKQVRRYLRLLDRQH